MNLHDRKLGKYHDHDIVLTLEILNQLLYDWHRSCIPPTAYIDYVNAKIRGRVIKVKSCHRINERIRSQAAKIASRCQKLSGCKHNDWYRSCIPPTAYSDYVNAKIRGRGIKVKSCHRINEHIQSQAAKIASRCQKLSSRKRSDLLRQSYKMSVLDGECESIDNVEHQVQQLEDGLTQKDEKITEILQEMAVLVAEEDSATEQESRFLPLCGFCSV